jgi:hypothetical protein
MGIFKAELRRHTGKEDVLTSRVFGALEILDTTKFLIPVLKQCGVELAQEVASESFSFSYWKTMGKRTPDVILEDKLNLIFFENNLGSSSDAGQLVEEYEDGIRCHKNFRLVAVTSDWVEPPEIQQAKELLSRNGIKDPRIQWINWQKIYAILRSNANNGNQTEQKLVSDLLSLLEVEGLSTFVQFPKEQLDSIADLWPQMPGFLEDCSALFGTVSSRLHNKNIAFEGSIRHGWIATILRDFDYWMPRWIGIRAWDDNWKERDWRQCLIILLRLPPLELTVGYRLSLAGNESLYELFIKAAQSCDLAEKLRALNHCSVTHYDGQDFWPIDRIEKNSLGKETFSSEVLGNAREVIIGRAFNHEEMASPKLLDEVEECLLHMRDIVNENGLYFTKQTIGSFTPRGVTEAMEGDDGQPLDQLEIKE